MAHVRASFLVAVLSLSWFVHGTARAEPIPARPAVVRGNVWHLRNTLTAGFADIVFSYGRVGDHFLMGDWDGDGVKTPGVVRGNTWYLRNSNSSGFADVVFKYGSASDVPIAGDWDGDGTDTPGVFRPGSCGNIDCDYNKWHLRNVNSEGPADVTFFFSRGGNPVVGDWDGDGDDTTGIKSRLSGRWEISNENVNKGLPDIVLNYGSASFIPIAGDWDGDERESIGAVGEGNVWFLKNENTSGRSDTHFRYGHWRGDIFLVWGESTT
jgi:hypothetical protein